MPPEPALGPATRRPPGASQRRRVDITGSLEKRGRGYARSCGRCQVVVVAAVVVGVVVVVGGVVGGGAIRGGPRGGPLLGA